MMNISGFYHFFTLMYIYICLYEVLIYCAVHYVNCEL